VPVSNDETRCIQKWQPCNKKNRTHNDNTKWHCQSGCHSGYVVTSCCHCVSCFFYYMVVIFEWEHATTYMTIPDVYLDDYLAETRWPPRWQHMWHHQLRTNWKDRIYGLSSRSDVCICWHLVCHHGCHQGECCLLVWSHKFSSGLYTVVNIWLFFLVVIIDCCQLVLSCRQSSQLSPQGCYFENVILLSFGIVVI
jgi:hypothetical protein